MNTFASPLISITHKYRSLLLSCLFCILFLHTKAQDLSHYYDSNFVKTYPGLITGRVYLSQKYTLLGIEAPKGTELLQFRPNTTINLGVGATYKSVTVNLAYGFGFLNKDKDKGRTRYLDLQSRIYGVKWRYDIFGQFYSGYFLYPRGLAAASPSTFYRRPDMKVRELGFNAYNIVNHKKYSYRAGFLQSEWQRKSAGSFLVGGGISYGWVEADSAFVPSSIKTQYKQNEVDGLRYAQFGPGAGYAYTLVIAKNWFIAGSLTGSIDLSITTESVPNRTLTTVKVNPDFLFSAVAGYNSDLWSVNFSWVANRTAIEGYYREAGYHVSTGNYRFNLSRRLEPGPKLKKVMKGIDRLLDRK